MLCLLYSDIVVSYSISSRDISSLSQAFDLTCDESGGMLLGLKFDIECKLLVEKCLSSRERKLT